MALEGLELTNPSFETRMILSFQAVSCYKVLGVNIILYTYTGHDTKIKTSKQTKTNIKKAKEQSKRSKAGLSYTIST